MTGILPSFPSLQIQDESLTMWHYFLQNKIWYKKSFLRVTTKGVCYYSYLKLKAYQSLAKTARKNSMYKNVG